MVSLEMINEKLTALEACIAKCEDIEYSVRAKLGDDKEHLLNLMKVCVANGRVLFNGTIENLNIEEKIEAYETYNNRLDNYLMLFPEYNIEQDEVVTMKI